MEMAMMLKIEKDFAGSQIVGARPYQEDTQEFVSLRKYKKDKVQNLLVVLADGMGGENAGDYASKSVVQTFVDYCCECDLEEAESDIPNMLRSAMSAANEGLAVAMKENTALSGMGCTLLACVVVDMHLYWISVGDSPLYLYREGRFLQLNEDHSMIPILQELVKEGKIHPMELLHHPDRNMLRSAIIGSEIDLVDCPTAGLKLQPGDIIVSASDGIQTLSEEMMLVKLNKHHTLSAEAIVGKLMKAVKRAKQPRQDNTSINVIRIPDSEKDLPYPEGGKKETSQTS